MNPFLVLKHKLAMAIFKAAGYVLTIPRPDTFVGQGSSLLLCDFIVAQGYKRVLLVTDPGLTKLNLYQECVSHLQNQNVEVQIFDEISPNPKWLELEAGISTAKNSSLDVVLAFGGGSAMDAGKIIAAGATNNTPVKKMEGAFKIKKRPLDIYAIPTTAGTGSEATPAAVVTLPEERRKFSIGDLKIVPKATALDADLMTGLPPSITAATGMDVLTHAIESFVSTRATEEVKKRALYASKVVFKDLRTAYGQGDNTSARTNMAVASYQAGLAIADAGVGYVHAIAHQLGGKYGIPHGLANAIVLPHVLLFSLDKIEKQLADLAQAIGLESDAMAFIEAVVSLNEDLSIPTAISELNTDDFVEIYNGAQNEAMALFPVPKYMNKQACLEILEKLQST